MLFAKPTDMFNGTNVLFFFMILSLIWNVRFELNHLFFYFIFLVLTCVT